MSSSQSRATRARIIPKSAARPNPAGWQAQLAAALNDVPTLLARLGLKAEDIGAATDRFPLRITEHLLRLIEPGNARDPILRQFLPMGAEAATVPGYVADPVGDAGANRGNGVLHKYRGRALLVLTGACAVHCRYCFRRHYPYQEESITRGQWRETVAQLRELEDLEEVILSGGDPLSLSDQRLAEIWHDLEQLPALRRIRIHTRLPVAVPERISANLVQLLTDSTATPCLVLHINHARELAPELLRTLQPLRDAGITLLNQAVLLRGVNDQATAQVQLHTRSFTAGVLPYYLHQLDPVAGAAHFAVSDEAALALMDELRARLPGYLVPRLVREQPGKPSKTPI